MKGFYLPLGNQRKDLDAGEIEQLARQGLNRKAIAKRLGVAYETFNRKLRESETLTAAYHRGSLSVTGRKAINFEK